MVGNDVVDLLDTDTDPARPRARFDARVCSPAERSAIARAADPSAVRWSLWAAKEAGYKLLRKREPGTVFSPVRFAVTLDAGVLAARGDDWRSGGVIRHGDHVMALALARAGGAVHALATWPDEPADALVTGIERLAVEPEAARSAIGPAALSAGVRALAIRRLAARLGVAPARLSIVKPERIPALRLDGAPVGADLSLSHHGCVVAFACRVPSTLFRERLAS